MAAMALIHALTHAWHMAPRSYEILMFVFLQTDTTRQNNQPFRGGTQELESLCMGMWMILFPLLKLSQMLWIYR